jgi:hypothetical protein
MVCKISRFQVTAEIYENQIISKSLGARKPNVLYNVANIGYGYLGLKENNLALNFVQHMTFSSP